MEDCTEKSRKRNKVLCITESSRRFDYRGALSIFLNLKEIAYSQLEEAKGRVNFLENKVKHYEDIVSEKIADDTNPKKWSESEEE